MELFKRYAATVPESEPGPFEMRSSPRVATSVPAEIQVAGSPGSLRCRLRDIGTGGVCVETPSPFSVRSLSRVTIHLPGGPLALDVQGTWQRDSVLERAILTGAMFLRPSPEDSQRLRKFIEQSVLELTEFLQARADLGDLGLDEAIDVALTSRLREAPAGTWICTAERVRPSEESLFVVLRGTVSLLASVAREGDTPVDQLGAGGVFGGVSLISDASPPFSAVARDDVTLLEIDRSAFAFLERAKPLVARRLARAIVARQVGHVRALISQLARGA